MYTWDWAWGKFGFLAALIIGTLLIVWRTPKRKRFAWRMAICCAMFIAETFLFTFIIKSIDKDDRTLELIGFFVHYIMCIFFVYACFDCDLWVSIFCAATGYCMQHVSQRLYSAVFSHTLMLTAPYVVGVILQTVITAVVYVGVYFGVLRRRQYLLSEIVVDYKIQIISSLCSIALIIFLSATMFKYITDNDGKIMLDSFSALVGFVLLLLQFTVLRAKRSETDAIKLKRILEEKYEQYEKERANAELIHIKAHDLRHQINNCRNTVSEEALRDMSEIVDEYEGYMHTGNEAIDTILTKEQAYCREYGIRLTCLINGEDYGKILPHELYALFGNAVENAINAVKELPEEKRVISVTEIKRDKFSLTRIVNYCADNIVFEDGLPVSQKDRNYHGFGVRSIRLISEKYGGMTRAKVNDDMFTLEIFLPLN